MNLAQLASTQVNLKKLLQLLEDIFHAFFADGKLSFAELKQHASEVKELQVLKTEFGKKTGCKSWGEAVERYRVWPIDFYNPNYSAFILKIFVLNLEVLI